MINTIRESNLLIFDMDGTLYEGKGHYDYYANHMMHSLPLEIQQPFIKTYEKVMNNEHVLKIGTIYDVEKDYVLDVHPISLQVAKAFTWDGEEISKKELNQIYVGRIPLENEKRFVSIGDGWWVPIAISVHFGKIPTFDSYFATKEYMVTTKNAMEKTEGLEDVLAKLRETKKITVVTNSDKDDAKMVLEALQLEKYFHAIVPAAKKPIRTSKIFTQLMKDFAVNEKESVSIGDNFLNEIYPALEIGMKGIHITNQPISFENENYIPVKTLANLVI